MTAIAPASLRQLAPGNAASSSSNTTINPWRPYQSTPSIRPLKVLAPSTSTRHIVLAPPSIGREAPSPLVQSQRPIKIEDTHTTTHDNTSKETQQSSQRADSIESTDSSSASANRLHSGSTFTSPPFGGDDDVIQPRKEWVLPARAKPGRKPSDVEPPTKRKAQNRASQRAFRERKQSYVASLEEKIQEYEARQVGLSHELQRMAKKLKEENESLKKENKILKERVNKLEKDLAMQGRGKEDAVVISRDTSRSSSVTLPSVSPLIAATGSGVRKYSQHLSTNSDGLDGSASIATMNRDCGFCTEQSPCVCNGEAALHLTDEEGESSVGKGFSQQPAMPLSLQAAPRPSQGKLWFTVPNVMGPPPPPPQICPTETRSRLGFGYAPLSNTLPPLRTTKARLWPVYTPNSTSQHTAAIPIYRLQRTSLSSKESMECSGDPTNCNACSTDSALAAFCKAVASHLEPSPSNTTLTPAFLDAGNALPLRQKRKRPNLSSSILRSSSTSTLDRPTDLYTDSQSQFLGQSRQTIPEAWQRITQHPSFPDWTGGLDLLADVVSKRSNTSHNSDAETTTPRVDIEREASISMKFHRNSKDRLSHVDPVASDRGLDRDTKRRRLYVDKESVEDALALLDQGSHLAKSCVCPLNRSL